MMMMMVPNAPFVIGEPPSLMDPSYQMGIFPQQYGPMTDMPSSPSTVSQFYPSNAVHYSSGFVPDHNNNNIATSDDMGSTHQRFLQHPSMSPSNGIISYGNLYVPNYGLDNAYMSSTMPNGTSHDNLSPHHPPSSPLYPMAMPQYYNHNPYVNNNFIPPLPIDMTRNLDSSHRTNHRTTINPYDPNTRLHQSSEETFDMPTSFSFVPSIPPPPLESDESKIIMESSSPPFVPTEEQPPIQTNDDPSLETNDNLNIDMNNLELKE